MNKHLVWVLFALAGVFYACQEEEPDLDISDLVVPTNLSLNAQIASDQSGNVTVTPSGTNVLYFHVLFNPGSPPVVLTPGQSAAFRYTRSGEYTAPVTLLAFNAGGLSSSVTEGLELDVRLLIDPETLQNIAGDGEKRWVWNQNEGGHFGVGPLTNDFPEFFSAGANSLNDCLYDDVLVFSYDDNNNYSYTLEPGENNEVFINWTEVNRFFPDATPGQFVDECRDITDQTDKVTFSDNFAIIPPGPDETRSTLNLGNSFASYFAVSSGNYSIVELTEDRLVLRGISSPFNGDGPLAWYSTFIPAE